MEDDPVLRQVCSEKTVQSDSKGFFAEFYEEITQTCGDKWLKNQFGKLKTDQDRIMSLFNDPQICDPVLGILEHVKPVYKVKDSTFSAQKRLQAERLYLNGDLTKALILLNQAIIRAPATDIDTSIDDGKTLALAYWARSTILIGLQEGERALSDLKLTLLNGLQLKDNPEYYYKMSKAYALMGEDAKSKISFGIMEKLLCGDIKIEKYKQELSEIKASSKRIVKLSKPGLTGGENPEIKSASKLVQMMETPDKGKYIAAKDNIKTGDIVLVEEPAAACLLPKFHGSHCHHCFEKLYTPVGCSTCCGIGFCSAECMTEACSTYHKYECQFLDLFIGSGMSILCFIALRIFTQAKTVQNGLDAAHELISKLCTHSNLRQPSDFLQRTLMAGFLLRCMQKANYFGIRSTEAVNPVGKELEVATALLGLLQLLQFNAHEIYETVINNEHRFDGSKVAYIGAGIYRNGSYMNHDCCPGVARYFIKKCIVLACTRPLISGEAVAENYGPIFTKMSLKERQRSLKSRYWFKCTCEACCENWPILQKLEKNVRFRCTTPSCEHKLQFPKDIGKEVRCARCRKNICLKKSVAAIIKCEELYRQAANLMKEQNTQGAIELFKEGIDLFHEVAVLPHKDTLTAQEALRTCFADTGNIFQL